MVKELSPDVEHYLASVVAGGLFPSQEAALEAAIVALREKLEPHSSVPPEHEETVEQGLNSLRAGRCRPFVAQDWDRLRQLARDVAAGAQHGGR